MSDGIIIAIIGGIVSIVSLGMTLVVKYNLEKVHKQVNSRMDELLSIHKAASKAEGNLEGRAEQKKEDSKPIN